MKNKINNVYGTYVTRMQNVISIFQKQPYYDELKIIFQSAFLKGYEELANEDTIVNGLEDFTTSKAFVNYYTELYSLLTDTKDVTDEDKEIYLNMALVEAKGVIDGLIVGKEVAAQIKEFYSRPQYGYATRYGLDFSCEAENEKPNVSGKDPYPKHPYNYFDTPIYSFGTRYGLKFCDEEPEKADEPKTRK